MKTLFKRNQSRSLTKDKRYCFLSLYEKGLLIKSGKPFASLMVPKLVEFKEIVELLILSAPLADKEDLCCDRRIA